MTPNVLLLNEAFDFNSITTIQGCFWGINLSLYFLCTQLFCSQYRKAPDDWKKLIPPFICNSIMILMTSLELGADTRLLQLGFIDHGGIHGEPEEFLASIGHASAFNIIPLIASAVISNLSSVVQIRRIWVMWEMSPYKPAVAVSLSLLVVIGQALVIIAYNMPLLGTPEGTTMLEILATVELAVGLTFTLLVTILLVGRIVVMRRRQNRLMGTTSENAIQYTRVIAMLIESYALDSVWGTAAMITFALSSTGNPVESFEIFNKTGDQVTAIAFLLVSYRVLSGRAWTPQTGTQVSSLRWNHNNPETTSAGYSPPVTTGSHMLAERNSSLV